MTDTTPAGQPPDTIRWSYLALLVAAAFSIIAPLVLLTQRTYLETSQRKDDAKAKPPVTDRTPQDLHNLITDTMRLQLILGIIVAGALVWVAIRLRAGSYRARWILFGLYILLALGRISLIGFFSVVSVFSSAPAVLKFSTFIGAIAFLAAVILATLRPSAEYVNRGRPPRRPRTTAGTARPAPRAATDGGPRPGLFATLFAPRPAPAADNPKTSLTKKSADAANKPSGQPMKRGKAKARTSTDTPPATPTTPATAKKQAKAKGR
jgi:hypothetical protein